MRFRPQIVIETIAEQHSYQFQAVQKLLKYVLDKSPYYKRVFNEHKIDIANIKSLSDLNFIPTTGKSDIQEYNWDFLCVPDKKIKEYIATTGSKGKPVNIALTENDLKRLAYSESQALITAGGKPGNVYQLMLPLHRQVMSGMSYYMGLRKLGATLIRTGPGMLPMQLETIERLQPDNLVVFPSFLLKLKEWTKEKGIDLNTLSVKQAICIGESIRNSGFDLNKLGENICHDWNIKLFTTYTSTEMQTSFMECEAGNGCHLQSDLIILEILNEEGHRLLPGEYGEVVVTTLDVEGMPLIRYRTGDICAYYDTPCSCGRNTIRLSPVIGRKQQMIKYMGTTFYPSAISGVLDNIPFITDYLIEVFSNQFELDEIRLHLVSSMPDEKSELILRPVIKAKFPDMPLLKFHTAGSFEQLLLQGGNLQAGRFLDNREYNL